MSKPVRTRAHVSTGLSGAPDGRLQTRLFPAQPIGSTLGSATRSQRGGVSTQNEVLQILGPPSQLIPLNDQVVYYDVLEHHDGRDLYLILYNVRRDRVFYDRAIFFFDESGVLTHHAYSAEEIPFLPPEQAK